ncbi:unnamed protein product [Tenebrio molitor]|nr:unnamed protein product [Tenebrio molitor]
MAPANLRATVLFLLVSRIMGHPRELLVDEEEPAKVASSPVDDEDDPREEAPCHMEYQVMKRVIGTCIKLGRNARGCVAGNYLRPLHPECM